MCKTKMKKKIIYVCYGGGHANIVAAIYKKMANNSQIKQIVVALTTARNTFIQEGIPYISFLDLAAATPNAQSIGKKLTDSQYQHPEVPIEESIAYMGLSYLDLVHEYGEIEASNMFAKNGRKAFFPKQTFIDLFNAQQPDLVITTNSPRAEKAAIEAAALLQIKSLCIVDLFNESNLRSALSTPGYGSKICVINDYAKEVLISAGRPKDEIVITGNPAFDNLTNPEYISAADLYKKKHDLTNQTTVLWARSVLPEDTAFADEIEQRLINYALDHSEVNLIIRPHPNEPPRLVPKARNIILNTQEDALAKVLHASDIVCTLYSTVAVEAFLVGKKVIQMTNTNLFKSFNCVKAGIAEGASSIEELLGKIKTISLDEKRSQSAIINNNAANKIENVIFDLLGISKG